MKIIRVVMLLALLVFVYPAFAQTDPLIPINALLTQAEQSLNAGDLPTAEALIAGAITLIDDNAIQQCATLSAVKSLLQNVSSSGSAAGALSFVTSAETLMDTCGGSTPRLQATPLAPQPTAAPTRSGPSGPSTPRPGVLNTPVPTPFLGGGSTTQFNASEFTFEYPADWDITPFEGDDGSVTLGTSPIGWLFPAFGIPVEAVNDNLGQWGMKITLVELDSSPPSPAVTMGALLSSLQEQYPSTTFGRITSDTVGSTAVAYLDFLGEGRRFIVFNPGGRFVAAVVIYSHPDEIDQQYDEAVDIIASIELN